MSHERTLTRDHLRRQVAKSRAIRSQVRGPGMILVPLRKFLHTVMECFIAFSGTILTSLHTLVMRTLKTIGLGACGRSTGRDEQSAPRDA